MTVTVSYFLQLFCFHFVPWSFNDAGSLSEPYLRNRILLICSLCQSAIPTAISVVSPLVMPNLGGGRREGAERAKVHYYLVQPRFRQPLLVYNAYNYGGGQHFCL